MLQQREPLLFVGLLPVLIFLIVRADRQRLLSLVGMKENKRKKRKKAKGNGDTLKEKSMSDLSCGKTVLVGKM